MRLRRADLSDSNFILSVINNAEIYNASSDDGVYEINKENVDLYLKADLIHILIPIVDEVDIGFFMLIQMNTVTAELHTCILPGYRGFIVVEAAQLAKEYIWEKTCFKKIVTQIPWFNKNAIFMALRCGFKKEGVNKQSFLKDGILFDQYYMGLCKE